MPGLEFSWNLDFIWSFLSITVIDIALSGDNAIVIGMAAASLPRHMRKWAVIGGGGLAILLRILLTSIATLLMKIPIVSAIGGIVLFWIVWKLLRIDTDGDDKEDGVKEMGNIRQALFLIITADFMMSLDNVLAIAGSARGNVTLLIAGLIISMPLIMTAGGTVSLLIDKFKWLVLVGAAVIAFTGARMILEDKYIESVLELPTVLIVAIIDCGWPDRADNIYNVEPEKKPGQRQSGNRRRIPARHILSPVNRTIIRAVGSTSSQ